MQQTLLDALTGDSEAAAFFADAADIAAILRFETALAEAEAEAGLIPAAAEAAIADACRGFAPDWEALAGGMVRDGVVVPELLRQLRARIGPPHAAHLHFGATSQDAIDTSLVLRLAEAIKLLDTRLVSLIRAFDTLRDAAGSTPLMGRTRMQRALPITAADKLANWSAPLSRHRASLAALRRKLLVIQLGGPVGTRAELGDKADQVAKRLAAILDLGLADPWHTQRDPLVEFGSLMALISGSLGKFGADIALMAQNEVAEITLAGGGGSSAMPHKSNPVNAEILVTLARHSAGLVATLNQALVHENERSGSAWTLEWLTLPRLVVTASASLRLATSLANQIGFGPPTNPKR
jgi:3-carboxy-cis,cis-muconate cycloisomerase